MAVSLEVSKSRVRILHNPPPLFPCPKVIKLMNTAAQEAGAVGCLIFTDPGDDGEITEENGYQKYPDGPARQVCYASTALPS